jgi:hypothetical protein
MLVNHHKEFHKLFLPIHQNIFERVIGFCFFDKIFQVLFLEDVFAIKIVFQLQNWADMPNSREPIFSRYFMLVIII